MDRTNWKFGEFNINILMLGITYKGLPSFDIQSSPKRGNPTGKNARRLWNVLSVLWSGMHRLPCGRPRVHRKGMDRMAQQPSHTGITFRIRQNFRIVKPSTGERIRAWWLFNDLKVGQRNSSISSFFTKVSMSILPAAGSKTPMVFRNCRFSYASIGPRRRF